MAETQTPPEVKEIPTQTPAAAKPVAKATPVAPSIPPSMEEMAITTILKNYIAAMNPAVLLSVETAAQEQFTFYRGLVTALENTANDKFQTLWASVLKIVAEHTATGKVFSERYALRGVTAWRGSVEDAQRYGRLIDLMRQTAPIQSRTAVLKQLDINKALLGFSDQAVAKVSTFYQI